MEIEKVIQLSTPFKQICLKADIGRSALLEMWTKCRTNDKELIGISASVPSVKGR